MLLLFLDIATESDWAAASLGAAAVGAFVRGRGHGAALLRVPVDQAPEEAARAALDLKPDLVGMSLACRQWPRAKAVAAALRGLSGVPVLAGGLLPTFAPDEVLACLGMDYACIGQGEEPAARLLDALARGERPRSGIPGLATREAPRPARSPDLDPASLPFWARDLCAEGNGVVHLGTRRGCPFSCAYCAAGALKALHGPAWGRRRPPGHVLAELRAISRAGDLNYVLFVDDTFTLDRDWLAAFLPAYAAEFGLGFSVHSRPDTIDQALAQDLARAGCRHVVLGLESGSERVRREVMGRPMAEAAIRMAAAAVRDAGLTLTLNAMYGLPGETPDEAAQTLALAEDLAPHDVGHFTFHPYPGTALFEACRRRGLLPPDWLERPADNVAPLLDLPEFPAAEVGRVHAEWEALRVRLAARRGCAGAAAGVC
ncbi:MAG: radical SAM protein [Thermodesulfobacteriota bacterium]